MNSLTPRIRMFAGPNGSGKSTLKSYLPTSSLGIYLNPDEIEQEIRQQTFLDFGAYGVNAAAEETRAFFADSSLLNSVGLAAAASRVGFTDNRLGFGKVEVNSYFAAAAADFLRQRLMAQRASFTFETVMSHPGKVALLRLAQAAGYRTYLYFVATDDPAINISRVRSRVNLGGHPVPEDRIRERYHRSLDLLVEAIRHTNRAYIFDNSGDSVERTHTWLAEITDAQTLDLKTDHVPGWFKRAFLDKIK